ncbi:PQQ-dependent sugar dehydrogenase [Roseiterribacter gracilis]|uniref:Sorbosone dehydrogenase n=1 Tax=Roseiterribacter gracilis TaxID=2812848 RepID=A0A8S8XH87_9PROT|nr:sorbosone dehydrogenase [Rhodospirillales bacterium TMPK1]
MRTKYVLLLTLLLAGCGEQATQPIESSYGKNPVLPAPNKTLLPTVNIAEAQGWPAGATPVAASGLAVREFAGGLDHPRTVFVLPNGDVLVAETNAPPKPDDAKGIKGWVMKKVQRRAGAATPSANRITLLRDTDGDGVADVKSVFLENLNSPFGMALIGQDFYVANSDAVVRFPYQDGQLRITVAGTKVTDLPAGTINHHWTKDLTASPDGTHLYASVGSNSNVGENGLPAEEGRAAIWEIDVKTGSKRIFASGLRNPNGLCWEPASGALWAAVNERDELGSDLVPDYMTSVKDGGFYGWPFSYYGQHVDTRVSPQNPALVAQAIVPDYALGAHTASLGLTFAKGARLPAPFTDGAFVGQHGSWNRKPHSGYKVVFVPFANGQPNGAPIDVLTGFLSKDDKAQGRPVGVAIDRSGGLLVADDVGNKIWRVTGASKAAQLP